MSAIEPILRREHGRVIAALVRRLGAEHLALAEESAQEASVRALGLWPARGIPEHPFAWLMTVARNHALDALRRAARFRLSTPSIGETIERLAEENARPLRALETIADDQLRMMVLCCHPALGRPAQVALTLNVVSGLSAAEIARVFFVPEATIAQRIVRAKKRLRTAGVRFETPPPPELGRRLDAVLDVVYLVFNEGYTPRDGPRVLQRELIEEALRLAGEICESPLVGTEVTGDAAGRAHALRALLCFQASRIPARLDAEGALVPLGEQDRERWDAGRIAEGLRSLARSRASASLSAYHLFAGVAACHATAPSPAETEWDRIVSFYDALLALNDTPIVRLNRAVAVGMARGPEEALTLLDEMRGVPALEAHHLADAARAEALVRIGRHAEASDALARAAAHAPTDAERRYLERRAREIDAS